MSDDDSEVFELDIDTFNTSTIFALENLQDITKRNDTITYDIKLLRTKNNNIALGNLYDISTFSSPQYTQQLGHNFTPNQFVNCQLFEDNTQLLKGKLQILDFNKTEYNAVITGEVVSLMLNIKDRYLHELDSLSQTTLYNYTYITPTWTSTTSPYIFPMLDYGIDYRTGNFDPYDNNFEFNNFRPAFYLKSYLNAIFKGFRFDDTKQVYTQKKEDNTLLNNNTVDLSKIESIINKIFIPNNFENFTRSEEGIITKILMSTPAQSGNNLNLQTINGVASQINSSVDDFWITSTKTNFKLWESSGGGGVTQLSMPTLRPRDKYINCTLYLRFRLLMPVGTIGTWMVGLADVAGTNKLEQGQLKHYTKVQKTDINISQEFSMEFDLQVDNLQGEFAFVFFREDVNGK